MGEGLLERETVCTVSAKQNDELMLHVTEDEVKRAIFAMHTDKSSGIDGLNLAFFQTYWEIVKEDVTRFCREFIQT